jgi:tetratricopeptide (TPR) repeat protein
MAHVDALASVSRGWCGVGTAADAGPVGEFCVQLNQLRIEAGIKVSALASRLNLSRTRMYAILAGTISRPPDWDRVVRPLVEACTTGDASTVAAWRQRHTVVTGVWEQLRQRDQLAERAARAGREEAQSTEVPRQLPAAVSCFTGRHAELAALTNLLETRSQRQALAVVISAIGGTAGVGKTALAVHWAHQVTGQFPDGQLYVNLRGYDPGPPMPATDALAGFLLSLGVPGQDIPPEAEQRAARYRTLLADKRMLVVLDNARSADQLRPLLPGTPACAVLVTSRNALAGLVARDGAARLDLDMLPLEDAVGLLRTLIGARVDADPAAAEELATQCCRLPLALRVAAELACSRPAVPLAALAGELADLATRLDLLDADGDPGTQVRTVFSWSYRQLDVDVARTFRLLGSHPGPGFEPYGAAALTGATLPKADMALNVLASAHLIQPVSPGRHAMHDLLRGYAQELTGDRDGGKERHAALTRLFDFYLYTAAAAMDTMYAADRHRRPRTRRPVTPVPPFADPAAAREWLDGERAALVAAAAHTALHGWPGHATRLAAILGRYLINGGHLSELRTISGCALDAARSAGDRAAEASALKGIGDVDGQQSRFQQARGSHRQALALFRAVGDRTGEASTLGSLGLDEMNLSRYEQAACYLQESVAILRDMGDRYGEARALGNLGAVRRRQGRYQEAASDHRRALDLSRQTGDRDGEAWALGRLGVTELQLDHCQQAGEYLRQALGLSLEIGSTVMGSQILGRLGEVYLRLGRYEQAAEHFEQGLARCRELGDRVSETVALNGLGEVHSQTGETARARECYAAALQLASGAGWPLEQARAHSGLARVCQADGDTTQARHHWQEALTRYTAIGAPEADQIRTELTMLSNHHRQPS